MERRDAILALLALPQVARIATTTVKPHDVIVVECNQKLTLEAIDRLRALVKDVWPGHAVLVCDEGVRVKVIEADPPQIVRPATLDVVATTGGKVTVERR